LYDVYEFKLETGGSECKAEIFDSSFREITRVASGSLGFQKEGHGEDICIRAERWVTCGKIF